MNKSYSFCLLGQPQIALGGQTLNDFATRKVGSPSHYLASTIPA
jgi:hypothetical protein